MALQQQEWDYDRGLRVLMIERILSIILPIFAIALIGYFYARRFKPNLSGANKISMDLALPALIFTSLSAKDFAFDESGLLLVASTVLIFASGLLALPLAWLAGVDKKAFLPCIMFGNVGPVGLPLTVLAFGEAGLFAAVLLLVLSNILHFTVGVWMMSGKTDLKSVFLSPLAWSTVLGLAFSLLRFRLPEWVDVTLTMIGDLLIPMMLLSLGARLAESETTRWRAGAVGAIATPIVRTGVAVALLQFLPLDEIQRGTFILFAALPPAIFNYLLADRFGRDPERVASIVMAGHLASIVALPLALYIALL